MAKKIRYYYDKLRDFRKQDKNKKEKTAEWLTKVQEFNGSMARRTYDIRARMDAHQKQLGTDYDIVMTAEDEAFYKDNCHREYITTCSPTVPK